MLSLNRKTDYALIALAYLADRGGQFASAREIAVAHALPLPLLMNILKSLNSRGIVRSTRGVRGGYQLGAALDRVSLYDLTLALEGAERASDRGEGEPECCGRYKIDASPMHGPVHAFHSRLRRFLQEAKLSDLVVPGRRIDVPVEHVVRRTKQKNGVSAVEMQVS